MELIGTAQKLYDAIDSGDKEEMKEAIFSLLCEIAEISPRQKIYSNEQVGAPDGSIRNIYG